MDVRIGGVLHPKGGICAWKLGPRRKEVGLFWLAMYGLNPPGKGYVYPWGRGACVLV